MKQPITNKIPLGYKLDNPQSQFEILLNAIKDIIYIKDEKLRYVLVNQAFLNFCQRERQQIIGHGDEIFLSGEALQQVKDTDLQVLQGKTIENFKSTDQGQHYHLIKEPIFNDRDQVIGICCVSRNITEVRKARLLVEKLPKELLKSHEAEKKRLSQHIHDVLKHRIITHKLNLQMYLEDLPPFSKKAVTSAKLLLDDLNGLIEETRKISDSLRPTIVEHLGLTAAIRDLTTNLSRTYNTTIQLQLMSIFDKLPPEINYELYCIIQEALNNALKHSRATRISVSSSLNPPHLTIDISDNGIGIKSSTKPFTRRGLGLAIMKERAELIGAQFNVTKNHPGGTKICVTLSLDKP